MSSMKQLNRALRCCRKNTPVESLAASYWCVIKQFGGLYQVYDVG